LFKSRIEKLLEENMTERGFKLWKTIDQRLPNIWDKLTSSTGKYHKKLNGKIPTIAEHVYEMLYAATKLVQMFDVKIKTTKADTVFLAIVLHDALKYGPFGSRLHTDVRHDKEVADKIVHENRQTFAKFFTNEQIQLLEDMIRYHSGKWSTDVVSSKFSFENLPPEILFLHMLDMMSTHDLIQTDMREEFQTI